MSGEDSRLAAVLGELADLGRRISERAAELAGLVVEGGEAAPRGLADRVAEVRSSVADLAAAAAVVSEATDQPRPSAAEACPTAKASKRAGSRQARPLPAASRGPATARRRAVAGPMLRAPAGRPELRRLMPAAVSVAVNLAVILGLAVIFVAAEAKPRQVAIEIGTAAEPAIDEMMPVELDAGAEAAAADEAAAESLPELEALAIEPAVVDDMAVDDAAFAVDPTAVVPVSFDSADVLAAVGGSGGTGDGSGGGGEEAGGGRQGAATFFGRSGGGQSICFVCDNSNSYRNGGFHTVLDEVARAVDSLKPGQSFFVVFFSDSAYPMFHPEPVEALQPASPENKRRLRAWLSTVEMCNGGQGIHDAVKLVAGLEADVVYFLSDGDHVQSVVDRIASADFGGAVVHTFGMQQGVIDGHTGRIDPGKVSDQQACDRKLVTIASAHGGTFTPVMVPPQAAALERLRPITKNRDRGPVWGTRL